MPDRPSGSWRACRLRGDLIKGELSARRRDTAGGGQPCGHTSAPGAGSRQPVALTENQFVLLRSGTEKKPCWAASGRGSSSLCATAGSAPSELNPGAWGNRLCRKPSPRRPLRSLSRGRRAPPRPSRPAYVKLLSSADISPPVLDRLILVQQLLHIGARDLFQNLLQGQLLFEAQFQVGELFAVPELHRCI